MRAAWRTAAFPDTLHDFWTIFDLHFLCISPKSKKDQRDMNFDRSGIIIAKARREKNEKSLADVNIGMLAEGIHMKNKTETRDQVLTVSKFRSILEAKLEVKTEGLKDFVTSTVKAAETGLRKEMQESRAELKRDITQNQQAIKSVKDEMNELRTDVKEMGTKLSDKIDSLHTRFDEHEAKPARLAHAH